MSVNFSFTPFRRAKNPPKSTGVEIDRLSPPDTDGTRTSMAKGINDVLNYYIQVADTKASMFLAGSIAAGSYLLTAPHDCLVQHVVYGVSAFTLGASLLLATMVILPRIPRAGGHGCVSWVDITSHDTPDVYRSTFHQKVSDGLIDDEYCNLNFFTAVILRSKIIRLRYSVILFIIGVLAGLIYPQL